MHTCALVRVGALEHARRVPRFGSGRTAARCHDAVGCAGDRRGLTAAVSLATNTRKDGALRLGRTTRPSQRSKRPDLGLAWRVRVRRRTGVCGDAAAGALKDEANKGKTSMARARW
jgi:hypothetical protein